MEGSNFPPLVPPLFLSFLSAWLLKRTKHGWFHLERISIPLRAGGCDWHVKARATRLGGGGRDAASGGGPGVGRGLRPAHEVCWAFQGQTASSLSPRHCQGEGGGRARPEGLALGQDWRRRTWGQSERRLCVARTCGPSPARPLIPSPVIQLPLLKMGAPPGCWAPS